MLAFYTKLYLALNHNKLAKDDSGVTAIEYGLIAALVAVVCITAWRTLGGNLLSEFNLIATSV